VYYRQPVRETMERVVETFSGCLDVERAVCSMVRLFEVGEVAERGEAWVDKK
jgi:hypothetical protein